MKILFSLFVIFSSAAFANQESSLGKIFLGGFTFAKENYLPTMLQFERTGQEVQLRIVPVESYDKCLKEFGTGTFEYSNKLWFSNDTFIRYKIPVSKSCSEAGSKTFRLEIICYGDTNEIKSVRLSPYRNKSYPYFSTEF